MARSTCRNGTELLSSKRGKHKKRKVWSHADEMLLIRQMQSQLPVHDQKKYWKRVAELNWQELRFGLYSAEDLQSKWTEMQSKIRTHRTLTELLQEAMELVNEFAPPDPPALKSATQTLSSRNVPISDKLNYKLPVAPVDRYLSAKRERYATRHPDLTHDQVSDVLANKFDRLPDNRKVKYMDACEEELPVEITRCNDEITAGEHRECTPGDDQVPAVSSHSAFTFNEWNLMSPDSKEKYIQAAVIKGKTESQCGPQLSLIETQILQNLVMLMPKAPPRSGYSLFYQKSVKRFKSVPQIAEEWEKVPQKEKDLYHQKYRAHVQAYECEVQKLKRSLKPDTLLLFETYVEKKSMKSVCRVLDKALKRLEAGNCVTNKSIRRPIVQ